MSHLIFGLGGLSECGKSTAGIWFDQHGVKRYKIVHFLDQIRQERYPHLNLDAFHRFFYGSPELREQVLGQFVSRLTDAMDQAGLKAASVESVRQAAFAEYMKRLLGERFLLIYIDAPLMLRAQRTAEKLGKDYEETLPGVLEKDRVKLEAGDERVKALADIALDNSGALEDLYYELERICRRYGYGNIESGYPRGANSSAGGMTSRRWLVPPMWSCF